MAKKAKSDQSKSRKRGSKSSAAKSTATRTSRDRKSSGNGQQQRSRKKTHLSKKELREFRQMLLEKRRDLIGDMSGMEAGALGPDRESTSSDISDLGSDNFEQEFTLGLLESERRMLAEINEALQRIDEGTYGICLGTNKPISKARLTARPWAQYSIEYARMLEKGLVRPGETVFDEDEEEDDEDDLDLLDEEEEPDETEEQADDYAGGNGDGVDEDDED